MKMTLLCLYAPRNAWGRMRGAGTEQPRVPFFLSQIGGIWRTKSQESGYWAPRAHDLHEPETCFGRECFSRLSLSKHWSLENMVEWLAEPPGISS